MRRRHYAPGDWANTHGVLRRYGLQFIRCGVSLEDRAYSGIQELCSDVGTRLGAHTYRLMESVQHLISRSKPTGKQQRTDGTSREKNNKTATKAKN